MPHVIVDRNGSTWNGRRFVPRADAGKEFGNMDELNAEFAVIKESGFSGTVRVVPSGSVTTESPLLEVEV